LSNTLYTADLHAGHRLVAGLRGFASTEDHDEALRRNWTQVVRPEDQIWILGDIAMNAAHGLEFVASLPGHKHLIAGNHDKPWSGHRRAHKYQRAWLEVFETVQPFAVHQLSEHSVLLSHFPYTGDSVPGEPDRFTQFRLRDEGDWLLHGHTHGKERLHGHQIHVGLDAWDLMPVPADTIIKLIGNAA
jgi:calcineurin-like phosphoesterase family protein